MDRGVSFSRPEADLKQQECMSGQEGVNLRPEA